MQARHFNRRKGRKKGKEKKNQNQPERMDCVQNVPIHSATTE
jgi:hypothetical protein